MDKKIFSKDLHSPEQIVKPPTTTTDRTWTAVDHVLAKSS